MRVLAFSLFLIGIVLSSFSCRKETDNSSQIPDIKPISTSINKILPLGASRVQGATPLFESYRYELWKDLVDNNWTFDFVGTRTDQADYPDYRGVSFDPDHEGRAGWKSDQILNELGSWLQQTGSPDIVLFSSPGGNDVLENVYYPNIIQNIKSILELLQANNPNVTILIEQPAPGKDAFMNEYLTASFDSMKVDVAELAYEYTTASSKVIAVNMYSNFSDSHLADDIHYNSAGAEFIAKQYYNVLKDVMQE